jgi:predicted DNA-binding transcriptional regulator AlpA
MTAGTEKVLRESEAAQYLGVSRRWLQERRADGRGPKFARLTARAIRYRVADLDEFLAECLHRATNEYD